MFFCYFFSLTGRQTVAFSLLIYSNASNGRNRIYFALWKQRPGAIIPLRWGGEAVSPLKAPLDKSQWKKIFNASETGIMSAWWLMSNPFMHLHFSKKRWRGGGNPRPPAACWGGGMSSFYRPICFHAPPALGFYCLLATLQRAPSL